MGKKERRKEGRKKERQKKQNNSQPCPQRAQPSQIPTIQNSTLGAPNNQGVGTLPSRTPAALRASFLVQGASGTSFSSGRVPSLPSSTPLPTKGGVFPKLPYSLTRTGVGTQA